MQFNRGYFKVLQPAGKMGSISVEDDLGDMAGDELCFNRLC